MRVLVTGAYGLIGSAVLARLHRDGHELVLVVSKELAKDIGGDSRERRVSQAAIAAISGLMPTMFMTRVRL